MKFYRHPLTRATFIFVWCASLLHFTFFMAEVSMLELNKNRTLVENAKKLLSVSSFEEESDSSESTEVRHAKEVDMYLQFSLSNLARLSNSFFNKGYFCPAEVTHSGFIETYSPPPDTRA